MTALVTGQGTAYLRLHGRNYKDWFSGQGRDARYDYSYTASELGRLAEVVARLKEQARKVFVSGNNHYKGSAVKNLLQLKEILLKRQRKATAGSSGSDLSVLEGQLQNSRLEKK